MKTNYRSVPFTHGWLWIRLALRLYRRRPLMWIAYSLVILIIGAGMTQIPVVGALLFQLIAPVFIGGLMLACRDERRGHPLTMAHLFSAFALYGSRLVTIGGIYLTGSLIALTLPNMLSDDPLIHMLYSAQGDPKQLAQMPLHPQTALILAFGMALFTFMLMLYWFAPALIVLGKRHALEAMKQSLAACAGNFPAFLLYGMLMFILLLLATLPAMLGFLIVVPVGFISYYTAYRDVFRSKVSSASGQVAG